MRLGRKLARTTVARVDLGRLLIMRHGFLSVTAFSSAPVSLAGHRAGAELFGEPAKVSTLAHAHARNGSASYD
jgi:hypothetical protein